MEACLFCLLREFSSAHFTAETFSYFVFEGPGSLPKNGGSSLEMLLFTDRHSDPTDAVLRLGC